MAQRIDPVRRRFSMLVGALILLTAIELGCASADAPTAENAAAKRLDVVPTVLAGMKPSGVPAGWYIFSDPEQWEAFVSKHHRGDAPEIDFGDSTLVVVFLGSSPNLGYSVDIVAAEERDREIVVSVVEYLPEPGMMYGQRIVYPYDAALIPKIGKPIRFETTEKTGRPR